MSKTDELKKEAEEYAEQCYGWCNNDQVTDVAIATYITSAEPREKRIEELEQKLEQTEKDLADYQFNYPTIKELEKENTELKKELKDANEKVVHLACNQNKDLKCKLTKAKELIELFVQWNYGCCEIPDYKDIVKQAEQFIKEIEK